MLNFILNQSDGLYTPRLYDHIQSMIHERKSRLGADIYHLALGNSRHKSYSIFPVESSFDMFFIMRCQFVLISLAIFDSNILKSLAQENVAHDDLFGTKIFNKKTEPSVDSSCRMRTLI
jgi:hypothetical protein